MINFNRVEQAAALARNEGMWKELRRHYHPGEAHGLRYHDGRHGSLKWATSQLIKRPDNKFWQAWVNFLESEEIEKSDKSDILKEAENILYAEAPESNPVKKHRLQKPIKPMGLLQREAREAGKEGLFRQMPDWILRAPRSPEYKIVYALLLSYQGVNDHAWPGYELLCEQAQVSKGTLSKVIKELTRDGLVSVKRRGLGMSNRYEVYDQFKGKTA